MRSSPSWFWVAVDGTNYCPCLDLQLFLTLCILLKVTCVALGPSDLFLPDHMTCPIQYSVRSHCHESNSRKTEVDSTHQRTFGNMSRKGVHFPAELWYRIEKYQIKCWTKSLLDLISIFIIIITTADRMNDKPSEWRAPLKARGFLLKV